VVAVERLISSLLGREGWSAATPASAAPKVTSARPPLPEPLYRADGEVCCPWHKTPLRQGAHGLYCPSKADGEQAGPKGYCRFSVKEA
jgi:hypothetical protein